VGSPNVAVLPLLRPSTKQDDKRLTILAKVDAISRAEIDAILEDAGADTLDVGEVARLQPANRRRHFRGCSAIERCKPGRERTRSRAVEIFENRQRVNGNTGVTISETPSSSSSLVEA